MVPEVAACGRDEAPRIAVNIAKLPRAIAKALMMLKSDWPTANVASDSGRASGPGSLDGSQRRRSLAATQTRLFTPVYINCPTSFAYPFRIGESNLVCRRCLKVQPLPVDLILAAAVGAVFLIAASNDIGSDQDAVTISRARSLLNLVFFSGVGFGFFDL